jgi:hypothetical protein
MVFGCTHFEGPSHVSVQLVTSIYLINADCHGVLGFSVDSIIASYNGKLSSVLNLNPFMMPSQFSTV